MTEEQRKKAEEALRKGMERLRTMEAGPEKQAFGEKLKALAEQIRDSKVTEEPKPKREPEYSGARAALESAPGKLARTAGEGFFLGAGDEAASLGAAIAGTMLPESMGGFPPADQPEGFVRAFNDIYRQTEGDRLAYQKEEPVAALGAELLGSAYPLAKVTSMANAGIRSAMGSGRPAPLRRFGENVGGTAAVEGAYGAAAAPEGDRTEGAMMGAVLGGAFGGIFGELGNWYAKHLAKRSAARSALQRGEPENVTVGYTLDESGQLVRDTPARRARASGVSDNAILAVKGGTPEDRQLMLDMLEIVKQRDANAGAAIFQRPNMVIGQRLQDRFTDVMALRRKAGEQIDMVAEQNLSGVQFDTWAARNRYQKKLAAMGVQFDEDGALDFSKSEFQASPELQQSLQNAYGILDGLVGGDALSAHRAKRALDTMVSYDRAQRGLTGRAEDAIKSVREEINSALQDLDETGEYALQNEIFADTTAVVNKIEGITNSKIDLEGDQAASHLGALMKRLTSNYASRDTIIDAVSALNDINAKYGMEYSDDLASQAMFALGLEETLGSFAQSDIRSEFTRALTNREADSMRGRAVNFMRDQAGQLVGIDRERAIEQLESLLRSYME